MKFGSMNGHSESEVESIFMSTCWGGTQNSSQVDQFLLDSHKLLLEHDLDSLHSDSEQKSTLDVLDNLLINTNSINNALADLKPLPPFTNYTANLSINGIAGHHYHAIAQRMPDESNNNYLPSSYHQVNSTTTTQSIVSGTTTIQFTSVPSPCPALTPNTTHNLDNNNNHSLHNSTNDHNLVSSSTCLADNILNSENDACLSNGKIFAERQIRKENKLFNENNVRVVTQANSDSVNMLNEQNCNNGPSSNDTNVNTGSTGGGVRIYTDCVDMTNIDELAAIISSAIADTTVNNQLEKEDCTDTRDSWMDIDAWIDSSIQSETSSTKLVVTHQDSLCDFILPNSPVHSSNPTLQNLLTHGYMPLLQNRLQNGPPSLNPSGSGGGGGKSGEVHSSTSFDMPASASSTSVSPPGSVVSTTADNLGINATFITNNHHHLHTQQQQQQQQQQQHQQQQQQQHTQLQQQQQTYQVSMSSGPSSIKSSSDGICSPDRVANYPHTTTNSISAPTSTSKTKRSRAQKKNNQQQQQQQQGNRQQLNSITPSSIHFSSNDLSGLLGKEKPVHRCTICNRGFLNKSNIKVHLRTHTGEKPFRCDVCAKAFRQKAHLLKHQQMHKRIGRD